MNTYKTYVFFITFFIIPQFCFSDWGNVEDQYAQLKHEMVLREQIEKKSYELTRSLCYAYYSDFKVAAPPKEFLESVRNWDLMKFYGFLASYYDGESKYILLARSNNNQRLVTSAGYKRAVVDCAMELNTSSDNISKQIKDDLDMSSYIGSFAGIFVGGTAATKGLKIFSKISRADKLFKWLKATVPRSPILKKFSEYAFKLGITVSLGYVGYTILDHYDFLNSILKQTSIEMKDQTTLNNSSKLESKIDQINEWAKLQKYRHFAKQYIRLSEKNNCNLHCPEFDQLQLEFSQFDINEIRILHQKMDSQINSYKGDFFLLVSKSLEKKSHAVNLNEEEEWAVELASYMGSLDLILNIN